MNPVIPDKLNIYIDYTEVTDLERTVGRYIGAGNYAREVIPLLFKQGAAVKVIVYEDFVPAKSVEKKYLSDESLLIKTGSMVDVDFSGCDVLFLPAATGHHLLRTRKLNKIRKKNRNLQIYAVIHDKQHGIVRFDPMDRFFREGVKRFLPVSFGIYLMKKAAYNALYPGFIKTIDKAFTVSNHSLQELSHKNLKRITYFYQPSSVADHNPAPIQTQNSDDHDYILFVSGGRPEKNLGRALLAYSGFYRQTHTDCKLYITGIDSNKLYYLAGRLKLSHSFIETCVRTFDYVSTEELAGLYRSCRYLLFVSKGEGFGLPVLEAIQSGKTVLCSWQSSIPEVAGSILYYVNAYSVDSIREGLLYLNDDRNLQYREKLVEQKKKIIDEQIELDKTVLVCEITGQLKDE